MLTHFTPRPTYLRRLKHQLLLSPRGEGVALGLHALRIRDVVTLLHGLRLLIALVRPQCCATQKPDTCADRCSLAGIATRRAE